MTEATASAEQIEDQPETLETETPETETPDYLGTATYDPADNKLRFSAFHRLSKEDYDRAKAAGFKWAPRQEIFVAPMWTPSREDLLIKWCGEIGDEDTSLVDRAEQRAERFDGYKENRIKDAEQARAAVSRIADNIPFGQPILVGHHSERHARKDAERIQNGMRKTVKMWETADYWQRRAAGALHHAKYKELPAVRARRIKTLTADLRKVERSRDEVARQLAAWQKIAAIEDQAKQHETAVAVAGASRVWVSLPHKDGDKHDRTPDVYDALTGRFSGQYAARTTEEVINHVIAALTHSTRPGNSTERWIDHYTNRIAYERAMLNEAGGLAAEQQEMEPGGMVKRRGQWLLILKVNKRDGITQSVTVSGHFATTCSLDEIQEYRAPKPGDTEKVKAAMKLAPLCNYPGEGFAQMTQAEYTKAYKDSKGTDVIKATETAGKHRRRSIDNFIARKHGVPNAGQWGYTPVFLTDAKRVDPPPAELIPPAPLDLPKPEREAPEPSQYVNKEDARIPSYGERDAMAKAAAAPVQVVAVPQLFPTPPDLARRMVELADIEPGHRVLEPSAGTGNILAALPTVRPDGQVVAVEIHSSLLYKLEPYADEIVCGDFLQQNGNMGKFDRILMNPPFGNAADIQHIEHARKFLKPGGRLVAICAGGPRQENRLMPLCDTWERLPADSFKESGTGVNTVLLSMGPADEE